MIKNVDLLEVDQYSYWNLIELIIVISIMPIILIFTSTLSSNVTTISFFIFVVITAIIIQLEFIFKKKKNTRNYILITILIAIIFEFYLNSFNINCFKMIVFIFSLLFFWFNANIFLSEIKKFLFSRFVTKNNIQLYTPKDNINKKIFNNYWALVKPEEIQFIDSNNNLINKKNHKNENTYFSIRRSPTYNTKNTFQPIFDLISCQMLLRNSNARQKYFNTMYIFLIIINFLYFLTSLFITKVLISFNVSSEFIYLFMVSIIIINLSFTIYLFIKHLQIYKCAKENILFRLQDNLATNNLNFSIEDIDRHYFTLNNEKKFRHNNAINDLEDTNKKLLDKLESIYQIATPILFLSQITLSIALIQYFTKEAFC